MFRLYNNKGTSLSGAEKTFIVVIVFVTALFSSVIAFGDLQPINSIKDIRFSESESFTRIVVECDAEISYTRNFLQFPDRLYFDIENTDPASFSQKEIIVDDESVSRIRIGKQDNGTSRVVIGLKSYSDFNIYSLTDPHRLVIDINKAAETIEEFMPRGRIVVIDPGHGGRDPGAIGRRGIKEKDIVLDIAKQLKKILESKYAVKVVLTREDDRYLELKERTQFANRHQPDLFVSLHINASRNKKTKGIETWFLNIPSSAYDKRIAARENAISEEKMQESQTELGFILASLERTFKREDSVRLAHYIQNSLVKGLRMKYKRRIEDHGVKSTLFYVLVGAERPSILVEAGFISNPSEELMLKKSAYRNDIANSIAKGINSFLSTLPDLPKLARR